MTGTVGSTRSGWAALALSLLAVAACSKDATPETIGDVPAVPAGGAATAPTAGAAAAPLPAAGADATPMADPGALPPTAGAGAGALPPVAGADGAAAGAGEPPMDPVAGGADATGGAAADPIVGGPVDGDPAAPMVEVPGVPCGAPNLSFLGVPQENMVDIGGRQVFVAYPCAHQGAAVTFFLFIHGTLQEGQKIPFTMTNFPVHTKVDSDNFIVVTPQAIGTQWGNGDGGQDLPHLYEVIDWVYATFSEQFDIRSMWASGGSWGAFYLSTFACDPMLEGRLSGVRMVVGGGCPRCSDRLACIVAQQELELGGGSPLSDAQKEMRVMGANVEPYAIAHGCGPREGPENLGPVRAWTWPGCDAGFAHSYYLGAGNHADRWDDPTAVDHMVAELKSIER